MSLFTKFSNGWDLAMNSFKVLRENKQLIIFPLLSGVSLVLIMGSFIVAILAGTNWEFEAAFGDEPLIRYALAFVFYLVNYFIVIFFNTALIHCTRAYFNGEEVSIEKGLRFSLSRVAAIFSWAVVAATVGLILRSIQENVGWLGKILTGIIGIVWGVATFFVVPVMAYENLGPIAAVKRSGSIMKEKWGESLSGNFSFALINIVVTLLIVFAGLLLGYLIHPLAGLVIGGLAFFIFLAVMSAVQSIFLSAVYHNVTGDPVKHFQENFVENLFGRK